MRDDPPSVPDQDGEEIIFGWRQAHRLAVFGDDPLGGVDNEAIGLDS